MVLGVAISQTQLKQLSTAALAYRTGDSTLNKTMTFTPPSSALYSNRRREGQLLINA